jgi:H/ACA ribonucleoprotein complex subunit 4
MQATSVTDYKLPFEAQPRTRHVKRACETNPALGCAPERRVAGMLLNYGVVNLYKPAGPTSRIVGERARFILKSERSGHGGTLDSGVTGVLPVGVGRGTRVLEALLRAGKEYICDMRRPHPPTAAGAQRRCAAMARTHRLLHRGARSPRA